MQCSTPIVWTQYKIGRFSALRMRGKDEIENFHLVLVDRVWRAGLEWAAGDGKG